jgi:group I intron endonuclease
VSSTTPTQIKMARRKIPAVYLIEDESTGRVYVGSTGDIAARLTEHSWQLYNRRHHNRHLQKAYNDGRRLSITYHPLSTEENALIAEQTVLDRFAGSGLLYNIALCASAPMRGRKASEETKEKMRRSMTGFRHSEETKKLLSRLAMERGIPRATIEAGAAARKGKRLSPEHIEKVRKASSARMTPEAREHLSHVNRGIKHTAGDVEKMTALTREKFAKPVVAAGKRYEGLCSDGGYCEVSASCVEAQPRKSQSR